MSLRILIADDHDMVRETIAMFLDADGATVTEAASDLAGALDKIKTQPPYDLVLLDYTMPGMKGLQGLQTVLDINEGRPVGLISGTATRLIAEQALEMGAIGFLPKTLPAKSLVNAVRFMAAGETYAPVSFMSGKDNPEETDFEKALSERERQVLRGLMTAQSNKEIARDLDLQEVTIKLHVKTLCRKLDAKNRTDAAIIARDAGFV
ncbi:MAG TPA: DNA-binding response regulator [Sulfitobacter sp.]|jgi:DNA-binding NarL/FixJ family response regulator|uniref:Transcriptional regulatory protein NarL n=1 Tax=Sulfitobacter dubius TaxID=218673 RepID=A0ABY3ZGT1_9RHOB|nr:response regulator transcription factor [Sulfitobacter dubius]MBM06733.1 DNA-binding response regulator [Sulfitobacter sp.]UOA13753.1 putative transcriptional regulatory protein NarL [Sulfitobacter dubius]WOI27740.1 response regulator transcription factor [Sulfitobacter dubius]SFG68659.1 two component transcriptional regulator, LuxR family [Sulfitobacter dubius]HBB83198.1 DNA-binding response regulator [Sulfitobacter sp.]